MYTTKDIKSITVQSVHLIIIRMNDNKSYIIDDNELVDMINKKIYLKKCRKSRVSARVSDDLKARLDGYESEIRGRMSKCRGKSEGKCEGKCDRGSDLGAAEAAQVSSNQAAQVSSNQATQLPTQVVSAPCSPLESKVSDFISNSFSSNPINSPNPTDNSIDKPIVINSTVGTPINTPINTPTISDCINTINTDVNTINTGNNSSNSYCCKIDTSISSSRCNNDNPSISDTTHIKTANSSSKIVNSSANSTNRFNRFKRFIKTIKSIFKTTRYN